MGSCGLSRGLTLLSCVVCKVSSPYENSYHHGDQVDSGNFAFTAAEDGDYTTCFWIPDSRAGVSIVTIEFDWRTGVAAKDWSKVAKKGQVEVMEFELKKLYDTVASIHEEMFYLRERLIPDGLVLTVPQDGTGHYRTVQEAIDAVPLGNTRRTVIRVSPGIYRQPLYVAKTKKFITFVGVRPEDTVFTWNNTGTRIEHHQGDRVIGTGTFGCGSIIVEGEDFIAENITFENSSPEGSGQAVAVRVTADRCAFYNCRFLGWQDTLYLHYGKQYLKDCYIEGSVDFIFGNSTALLEHCHIHCKSAGFITAQSRKSPQETTGYVFLRCVITGNGGTSYSYLGRPCGPCGRVVFAFTYMDQCIKHVGWNNWGKFENERSACFYEYRCFGPGCCPSKRVKWARQLMDKEAEQFLMHGFIDPEPKRPWLAQRMALRIPYSA